MAGLSTGTPIVQVYHEKSRILPDVSRVLACLYEKDIKFDRHTASYRSLLKLQASTHAPVPFYDGPTFLEESREICHYIAEKYEGHGYPFLLGKDALERASVEQWLHNEEHAFNPPSRALFCHLAFPPDKDDNGDDIDMHTRKLEEVLEVYEQRLSDSEFLAGNKFTLADLVHLPNSHYITSSKDFLYLYDSRKNVRRWWDAISTRDSWKQVLMDMKRVEEKQKKQVELKEQQQRKNHPRTPGYPLRIYSRMQTTTEPQTVLMHSPGTVSSSPIAPQTEKPLSIDIPDEALVSSRQSTPTDHKISLVQSKETPFEEEPPKKSPVPVQSTIAPATFPITSEKPPIVGPARLNTKDDYINDVQEHPSQDSEQATSHPVLQESMSTELVQGQEKITRRPYTDQRRDVSSSLSQQTGGPRGIAVHDKSSSDQSSALLPSSRQKDAATPPSRRAAAKEANSTSPPQEQYQDGQDPNKPLRDTGSMRQSAAQARFGGSSNIFRSPLLRQDLDAACHTTAPFQKRDPSTEDTIKKTDTISTPWPMADQDTEDTENTTEETRIPDSSSSLVQPLYFQRTGAPSGKQETTEGLIQEKETTENHHGATSSIHKWHANIEDMYGQYRDIAFKPKQMISQDDRDTFRETKFGDPSLLGEQPSDTRQAPSTTDKETNQDGFSVSPPSKRTQTIYPSMTASKMRYPIAKDASKKPRVTDLTPRHKGAQDDNDTSEGSTIADEVASTKELSNARRAPTKRATPDGHEIDDDPDAVHEDAHHANLSIDEVDKDTFGETKTAFRGMKNSDSTPPGVKPMYAQRPAFIPSRHAKFEDAGDKGMISRNIIPEQQKMLERKTGISGGQSPDPLKETPSRQAGAENGHGATSSMIHFPDICATSKKLGGTIDEAKDPDFTLPEAQSLNFQDAQQMNGESTTPAAEKWKESEFKTPKVQPTDSQDNIREEKTSSYRRKPPVAQPSQDQAQTMPTGAKADVSAPKHHKAFYVPHTFDKELSAYTPSRSKTPDDHNADDQKLAPLLNKESSSQVQPPSVPSKDLSSKPSTINQWQRASAPLDDVSSSSDDREMAMSTIDQKQGTLGAEGANQMAKESSEWKEEPPLHIRAEPSGVRSASPSYPGASVVDHATTKDKFANQSTNDERVGEPITMQASNPDANPASDGHVVGHSELVTTPDGQILESTRHDSATVHKDVNDANLLTRDEAKDTFKGMKVADSTSYSVKPIYTQQTSLTPSKPAEARDEDRQSSKAIPEQQTMVERETGTSGGQLSDHCPSGQAAPEDARGATVGTIQSPDILDTTKKSRSTFEESKTPGSTLPNVQSFGSQDVQYTNGEFITPTSDQRRDISPQRIVQDVFQRSKVSSTDQKDLGSLEGKDAETIMAEKKLLSTERLREILKESESTMLKAQPSDTGGSTREGKQSSIYQKRPLTAQDSQEQAQTILASEKADGSTLKHQQSSDPPYTLDEKFISSAPERADIHDDPRKEASYRKYTTANQKVGPPLLSQKLASHVLPPSEPYHDAPPREELYSDKSIIEQWERATAPLKGASTDSDHNEMNISSNIKEKPMPMNQEAPLSSQHVNQIDEQSGEQTREPPVPVGTETSDIEHNAPSPPEAATNDHAIIDDKFAKQSIMNERLGEPRQMQAPITDAHPTSLLTKGKTPDGHEPGDLELVDSSEGQILDAVKAAPPGRAKIHEDSHAAAIDDNQLVTGSLHEQARPPAPIHETTELLHGPTSMEPQLGGSSQMEVAHAEHKFTPSGKKPARTAELLSPNEPVTTDSDDSARMKFRQQTRPSASIIRGVPTTDGQNVEWKIQEVTPDNRRTDDSAKSLVPSQEDMTYSPSTRNSLKPDYQFPSAQVHEVTPYESDKKQGSHVKSAFGPGELGPAEKKYAPSDQGLGQSVEEPSSAEPRKELPVVPAAEQIKTSPRVISEQGTPKTREVPTSEDELDMKSTHGELHPTTSTKPPRSSSVEGQESTSLPQSPPLHVAHESLHTGTTPDDAHENVQSMKPSASPDAQHDTTPRTIADEITSAERKFVPSGQDSVHSKQLLPTTVQRNEVIGDSAPETLQISSSRPRKGDSVVATPDQAKGTPTTIDQQEILSAAVRSVSPSSVTQRPSEKAQEDAPADDLGKLASRPPSDILDKPTAVVPASAATDKALDKQKFIQSGQHSVHPKQPSFSPEQRNEGIGDSAPSTQWISSTKPRKGDVDSAPDQAKDSQIAPGRQDILPPVRSVSRSSDIQHPSGKVHNDVRADELEEVKPIVQASGPNTQDDTTQYEKKIKPSEPTSSIELRNEEIRDSAPLKQLASSTETRKENATIIAAPDQEKDLQTTLDQPDILSTPITLASPFSDTHGLSQKAQEDVPADDLGEASSKLPDLIREVRPSTVVPAPPPVTQQGAARDETLDKQKFVPSGQDSVHSTLPRNGEIGDSAPSTQQISPTRPRKGDFAASAPDQAKDTQITLGGSGEDLPTAADASREVKRIAQTSAPDIQEANKFVPSGQISPAEPKNKEIRDSAPSTRLISSTDTRKEDSVIAAPDQDKDSQTTIDQQDMLSAPVRSASPSSNTQSPSEKAQEDAPADDLGDDASKSLALDREVRLRTVVPASSPATLLGVAPDETAHHGKVLERSGQDSALQPSFSSEQTKEDTIVMAADQTKDPQTMINQQNITPATDTEKTPLSGTKYASRKSQKSTSDDIDSNESVPGEEQVSLGQRDSHRREGHATKPYGITIDEKTTKSPSSKTFSLESGSDLTRAHSDVHPSTGEEPTTTSLHEHGLQTQPPLATQSISLDTSRKVKSTGQEGKTPVAAASETQPGSTQEQDETAPVEQNFSVSDQESAHASKSLSAAGPRKGEKYVFGPTDQMNVPQTILGNQATRQTPHAREALSKFQESSHDDDHIRNLVSPLISQEQASHAQRPSEGPTSEAHSAFVDKKTTLPSSQVQTSNTEPDSTPITGDAHLINADMPAASNSQNQEAQSPAATQAPTTQALQGSASSHNVHDDYLQNIETPRQRSKDEVMAPVTHSAAYSDAPNSEPGTATVQPPQKVAFDLSGGEKITATQDDQVNTLLNGDLPSSQQVRTSESTDFKGTNSEQKLEGASTYDKSNAQHQNDQLDTPSSKGNSKEANEAIISDLSTPYREQQKQSSWPKESMESSGEQADKAIDQSPDNNLKQIEQTKIHHTETGEPEEREIQENTNRTDNKVSRVEALDNSGKQTSGVQLRSEDTKDASNSTNDALDIQARSNSEGSLRSSEESKVKQQPEGKTQGGETEPPRSDTLRERSLPENSSQNKISQSEAEASGTSAEKLPPGIQDKNKNSSGLDGQDEGTKSGDAEDKSG